jgi:hypothetical protein
MLNYETMELEEDITPEGFEKRYCKKLAISKDGKYLAGVTESNSKIVIFDLDTRKQYRSFKSVLMISLGTIMAIQPALSFLN